MATYAQLIGLRSDSDLGNKIKQGIRDKAHAILDEVGSQPIRRQWALDALANPESVLEQVFSYVLVENEGNSLAVIQSASDASIQTNVNSAVDKIVPSGA